METRGFVPYLLPNMFLFNCFVVQCRDILFGFSCGRAFQSQNYKREEKKTVEIRPFESYYLFIYRP